MNEKSRRGTHWVAAVIAVSVVAASCGTGYSGATFPIPTTSSFAPPVTTPVTVAADAPTTTDAPASQACQLVARSTPDLTDVSGSGGWGPGSTCSYKRSGGRESLTIAEASAATDECCTVRVFPAVACQKVEEIGSQTIVGVAKDGTPFFIGTIDHPAEESAKMAEVVCAALADHPLTADTPPPLSAHCTELQDKVVGPLNVDGLMPLHESNAPSAETAAGYGMTVDYDCTWSTEDKVDGFHDRVNVYLLSTAGGDWSGLGTNPDASAFPAVGPGALVLHDEGDSVNPGAWSAMTPTAGGYISILVTGTEGTEQLAADILRGALSIE